MVKKEDGPIHEEALVLLVEDDLSEALNVQELLKNEGANWLNFACCNSVASALQFLRVSAPDIVLLDLTLPDSIGLSGLTKLRKESLSVPILLLTGLDDQELAIKALKSGAHDYVIKTHINGRALLRIIEYSILRTHSQTYKTRLILMEQREEFMATLTHDLKNPLLGANRILEHLTDGRFGDLNKEQQRILRMLKDSNKSLVNMVQTLIEVYKHKKGANALSYEEVDIRELVASCLTELLPHAQARKVEVKSAETDSPLLIEADGNSIRRVIQNLLDNALKFTPSGGCIEIRLKQNHSCVAIEIEDTGAGITAEEIATLFQPFHQGVEGRKYSPGTGLGLYLCRQIVEAHQGTIDLTSSPGQGTTFLVTLPFNRAETAI